MGNEREENLWIGMLYSDSQHPNTGKKRRRDLADYFFLEVAFFAACFFAAAFFATTAFLGAAFLVAILLLDNN